MIVTKDLELVTEEAIRVKDYINKTWPKFRVELEKKLNSLFPEPKNVGLKHIWKYGSADIVVYKDDKIIAIFEPGGSHHFQDEKQIKNDKRKYMLCNINGVNCLKFANSVIYNLSKRQMRKLFGKYLFKML